MSSTEITAVDYLAGTGGIVLLFLCFVLVMGLESLNYTSMTKAELLSERYPKSAGKLKRLLAEPKESVGALRIIVLASQLSQVVCVGYLAVKHAEAPASWVVTFGSVLLSVFVTETVPRSIGYNNSDRLSLALAGVMTRMGRFWPARILSAMILAITDLLVPGKAHRYTPFDTPEEFIALADAAVEDDVIEVAERDLIESVISFGDTVVREVMVPRTDMITIGRGTLVSRALEAASDAGLSRLPVVGDSADDILGLVYVKDLIKAEIHDSPDHPIDATVRPARFVPESKKVAELLGQMQRDKFHMAIAIDEHGGVAGLVTLEDLVEEIVGEIVDEYDTEEPLLERLASGEYRVDGRLSIAEFNELTAMALPMGGWDTVGGLVFDLFGSVPSVGETVEVDGHQLAIERVQGRRISRIRVRRIEVVSGIDE